MNDLQSEDVLEGVEIAIAVEQRMRVLETERRDEAIDCLPDGPPASAQAAIVSRSRLRESDAAGVEDLETAKCAKDSSGGGIGRDALEHLAHRQVEQPQTAALRLSIEPLDFGCADAVQVVDPDRRVDDHHVVTGPFRFGRAGWRSDPRSTSPFPAGV